MIAAAVVVGIAVASTAALVAWFGARPLIRAAAAGSPAPRPAAGRTIPRVAAALAALTVASVWLALEWAHPGGLLARGPLLEQLLALAAAVWLGGCLAVLPWQPRWVAAELRRVAVSLPVATGAVLLVSSRLESTTPGAVFGAVAFAAVSAAVCGALSRAMLSDPGVHPGHAQRPLAPGRVSA